MSSGRRMLVLCVDGSRHGDFIEVGAPTDIITNVSVPHQSLVVERYVIKTTEDGKHYGLWEKP